MMLDILDALLDGAHGDTTTHAIARRFIYPGLALGRGVDWKSSAERRRTQRIIDEAKDLAASGYLTLLRG